MEEARDLARIESTGLGEAASRSLEIELEVYLQRREMHK